MMKQDRAGGPASGLSGEEREETSIYGATGKRMLEWEAHHD